MICKEGDCLFDEYGNELLWTPKMKDSSLPLYISIANSIKEDILNGTLDVGFKLPPQRVLANYLGINHSTVTRAYKLCEEKGLIKGVIGKGTFVNNYANIPEHLLTNNAQSIIEMGMVLPLYELNDLIEKYIKEIYEHIDFDSILRYVPPEGHINHRYIASNWFFNHLSLECSPDQIIITSGSQNALSVILTCLFEKGDRIIVDEYTYTGIKSLVKLLDIILVPVKTTRNGIDIDHLKATLKRENIKGIYLIPDCHNPTTATISEDDRIQIAELIKKHNLLLIEDGTFRFSTPKNILPISCFIPDLSIYIAGTSKAINPAFRISYICSPEKYLTQLKQGVHNLIWMVSPLNAEIVSYLLNSSRYQKIIQAKALIMKKRNELVDDILGDFNLIPNKTSLFRYLSLPESYSEVDIESLCLKNGVQVFSLKRFSLSTNPDTNAIRLSISGPDNIKHLEKGLLIIKEILKSRQTDTNLSI